MPIRTPGAGVSNLLQLRAVSAPMPARPAMLVKIFLRGSPHGRRIRIAPQQLQRIRAFVQAIVVERSRAAWIGLTLVRRCCRALRSGERETRLARAVAHGCAPCRNCMKPCGSETTGVRAHQIGSRLILVIDDNRDSAAPSRCPSVLEHESFHLRSAAALTRKPIPPHVVFRTWHAA